jgi:hypothetical protein
MSGFISVTEVVTEKFEISFGGGCLEVSHVSMQVGYMSSCLTERLWCVLFVLPRANRPLCSILDASAPPVAHIQHPILGWLVEWWSGKDLEGGGHVLIWDISAFAWMNEGRTRLSQDSRPSHRDSNPETPEYEPQVLSSQRVRWSVLWCSSRVTYLLNWGTR